MFQVRRIPLNLPLVRLDVVDLLLQRLQFAVAEPRLYIIAAAADSPQATQAMARTGDTDLSRMANAST